MSNNLTPTSTNQLVRAAPRPTPTPAPERQRQREPSVRVKTERPESPAPSRSESRAPSTPRSHRTAYQAGFEVQTPTPPKRSKGNMGPPPVPPFGRNASAGPSGRARSSTRGSTRAPSASPTPSSASVFSDASTYYADPQNGNGRMGRASRGGSSPNKAGAVQPPFPLELGKALDGAVAAITDLAPVSKHAAVLTGVLGVMFSAQVGQRVGDRMRGANAAAAAAAAEGKDGDDGDEDDDVVFMGPTSEEYVPENARKAVEALRLTTTFVLKAAVIKNFGASPTKRQRTDSRAEWWSAKRDFIGDLLGTDDVTKADLEDLLEFVYQEWYNSSTVDRLSAAVRASGGMSNPSGSAIRRVHKAVIDLAVVIAKYARAE